MATNHTTNYQLCQWEATDKVLRTDFNQDNQKIDAALAAHDGALAGKAGAGELSALVQRTTALEARPTLVTGTYTGNGASSQFISLGSTPKAVLVMDAGGYMSNMYLDYHYGGLALDGAPVTQNQDATGEYVLSVESGGFRVYCNFSAKIYTNDEDTVYHYLAVL